MATNGTPHQIPNFNIGVLGHVDSGKTSLSKALSTTASTAAFDKNPQSKERGITLDLGFSSFLVPFPEHLVAENAAGSEWLQFTLVDCPGHASLIKTIIGGAQIIDMMMLIVDITKGMQTQTAECLVIGEILCEKMIVVLNKVDQIAENKRDATIEKMKKRMSKTLENTKFKNCPIVAVAAKSGANDDEGIGLTGLVDYIKAQSYIPKRDIGGPFMFSVDHCFTIKGHGIVMTGTVLNGSVSVNDNIEIPAIQVTKKVKSMQMFRKPVTTACQGDRVGICVTQFDSTKLERGIVCTPGYLPTLYGAILPVHKIPYFKGSCQNKSKFHITIGHETVMATLQFFGPPASCTDMSGYNEQLDTDLEYQFQDELGEKTNVLGANTDVAVQFVILEFDRPITCTKDSLVIGSRLDTDINLKTCRLAFHGRIQVPFLTKEYRETHLAPLKIFKSKKKEGSVERMNDEYTVIVKSLFKKETNLQLFSNMKVKLSSGEQGLIEGSFGQSGKIKVRIPDGLSAETKDKLSTTKKGKGKKMEDLSVSDTPGEPVRVTLEFKKYVFDTSHKMIQT